MFLYDKFLGDVVKPALAIVSMPVDSNACRVFDTLFFAALLRFDTR